MIICRLYISQFIYLVHTIHTSFVSRVKFYTEKKQCLLVTCLLKCLCVYSVTINL